MGKKVGFPITHILKPLDTLTPNLSSHQINKLSTIVKADQVKWPSPQLRGKCTEKEIFSVVAKEVLLLVADSLTLELEYRDIVSRSQKINFSSNGMGDPLVWHGKPDAFLNTNIPVHNWNASELELECEEIVSSDYEESNTICVEAKRDTTIRDAADPFLSQVVSSAVVNAFIEANTRGFTHPIPALLINGKFYRLCLYDSHKDVLLVSEVKSLGSRGRLSRSGLLLLWIIAHHR